jgi:hypothetical protein
VCLRPRRSSRRPVSSQLPALCGHNCELIGPTLPGGGGCASGRVVVAASFGPWRRGFHVPGVSWRPRQGVAATRRPGRDAFAGKFTGPARTPAFRHGPVRTPGRWAENYGYRASFRPIDLGVLGNPHESLDFHGASSWITGLPALTRAPSRRGTSIPRPLPGPSAVSATATPCRGRGRDGRKAHLSRAVTAAGCHS